MKSYKKYLYGLFLASCIHGSIFTKSGLSRIHIKTPKDGNTYVFMTDHNGRQPVKFDEGTLDTVTINPKRDNDDYWFNKNGQDLLTARKITSNFKNQADWLWTIDSYGNNTISPLTN